MISFDKAVSIVMSKAVLMDIERVALSQAAGRILARDVRSDVDMPWADLSAMDGYACRKDDLALPLRVIETVAAGALPQKRITAGTCARIMTGARIPVGADTVVTVEDTVEKNGVATVARPSKKTNIRLRAEDIAKGGIILKKGSVITPAGIAALASAGCAAPFVYRRVRVGIVATGSELVEADRRPLKGQIRNSNGPQLAAQVGACGGEPVYYGIAKDSETALCRCIKKAIAGCDVVLLSGGVSMGDFDHVPGVLKKIGVKLLFERVAVKPGKPTVFGVMGRKRVFGLPGNPVSSFGVFETIVMPFLRRMMGVAREPRILRLPLARTVVRRNPARLEFRPAALTPGGTVDLPEYHGSAHILSFTQADGMAALPAGVATIKSGEMVEVRMIGGQW